MIVTDNEAVLRIMQKLDFEPTCLSAQPLDCWLALAV